MITIATASVSDVIGIAERRDCDIVDAHVKECVVRHSSRLGRLVNDVSDTCTSVNLSVPSTFSELGPRWVGFVTNVGDENRCDLAATIRAVTKPILQSLEQTGCEHERFEEDSGSSSASDYSDSNTESTTSEESETEQGEEEEEEAFESDDERMTSERTRVRRRR